MKVFLPKSGDLRKKKRSSPKLKQFFRPKLGDLQKKRKKRKKKVFTQMQSVFLTNFFSPEKKKHFFGPNHSKFFTTSDRQSHWGGLFSFLEQKSASKALKTWYFVYFSGQWGARAPPVPPWLRYWLCLGVVKQVQRAGSYA